MNLSPQEIEVCFEVVMCKCCGNKYKAHVASNALTYSNIPNYGCEKCKGVATTTSELAIELPIEEPYFIDCPDYSTNKDELKERVATLESVLGKLLEALDKDTDWWGYSDMIKELDK